MKEMNRKKKKKASLLEERLNQPAEENVTSKKET